MRMGQDISQDQHFDSFDVERGYRTFLVRLCMVLGIPSLAFFVAYDFLIGRYFVGFILLLMFLAIIGLFFLLRLPSNRDKRDPAYHVLLTFLFIAFGFHIAYVIGVEGRLSRIPWAYLFPVVVFFALGEKSALVWVSLLFLTMVTLGRLFPLHQPIPIDDLKLRFYISFLLVILASFLFERLKKKYQIELIRNQETLKRSEKRYRTAYEQLDREMKERERVEEALRDSEEKYRLVTQNANDAIFIVQDQVIKFPNPKVLQLAEALGLTKEELHITPFPELVHPEDRDMVVENHRKRLGSKEVPPEYSFRLMSKAGTELWVDLNAVLIDWEGRPATLNFLRDVTEKRKLEAQLQHAQRMEAIGTLAGGVAHDFNNLLMVIQGNASCMLFGIDASHPHYQGLKTIEKQVKSGAELSRQLLGYARKGKYEVNAVNMNHLLEETSLTFGRTRKEVTIYRELSPDLLTIEADKTQIERALLNLFVNAADAMPRGGHLTLRTMNTTHERVQGKAFKLKPGNYVSLTISDTGTGMDDKTMERIFEPFFTTKNLGRGTGLGLASVYGIIKGHGGYIDVESELGAGSTFTIFLPASNGAVHQEVKAPAQIVKGSGVVLLVDDEEGVLDAGVKMLQNLGYETLSARSGREAIESYKRGQGRVDMVILDVIMPECCGGEVYDRLKEIDPDVRVLLSSGYTLEGQAEEILNRGCNGFVQKPFDMEVLSRKIRELSR